MQLGLVDLNGRFQLDDRLFVGRRSAPWHGTRSVEADVHGRLDFGVKRRSGAWCKNHDVISEKRSRTPRMRLSKHEPKKNLRDL